MFVAKNYYWDRAILLCNYKLILTKLRLNKYYITFVLCVFLVYFFGYKNLNKCLSFEEMVIEKVNMENKCLLNHIRSLKVLAPSEQPYNLTKRIDSYIPSFNPTQSLKKEIDAPWVQALIAVETFVPKRGQRRFVECGAADGVTFSTTLYMEKFLNWTGVLIEPDDKLFSEMKFVHRKAYGVHACVSLDEYPTITPFISFPILFKIKGINKTIVNEAHGYVSKDNIRGIALKLQNLIAGNPVQTQCLPLYSILLAVNISVIDLMVLDVQGAELEILKTLPFKKIDIAVLLINFNGKSNNWREKTRSYLISQGYSYYDAFQNDLHPGDDIFIQNEYFKYGRDWKKVQKLKLPHYYKILTGKENSEENSSDFEYFVNIFLPFWI